MAHPTDAAFTTTESLQTDKTQLEEISADDLANVVGGDGEGTDWVPYTVDE